jgi:hypothetical protein
MALLGGQEAPLDLLIYPRQRPETRSTNYVSRYVKTT